MSRILLTGLVALALNACKPMGPDLPKPGSPEQATVMIDKTATPVTVADAEAALRLEATVDEMSRLGNVVVEESVNKRSVLDLTTVTVTPPFPAELWVTFHVSASQDFTATPVALRADVYEDDLVVDSFSEVFAKDIRNTAQIHRFNVLANRTEAPDTLLVYARGELSLMPEGTDPATVDANTAIASPENTGHTMSNPIRINFVREGQP